LNQKNAKCLKDLVISSINTGLEESDLLKLDHCYLERDKRLRVIYEQNRGKKNMLSYHSESDMDDYPLISRVDEV